jgi:hypothetical protein
MYSDRAQHARKAGHHRGQEKERAFQKGSNCEKKGTEEEIKHIPIAGYFYRRVF